MADHEKNDDFRNDFRNELNSRWTTEQLRELIESVNKERDRRYTDKFEALTKEMHSIFATLKEKMEAGFAAAKDAVASALVAAKELVSNSFESSKQAIAKAETATEKRFESVNEFRSQLKDQQVTLLPRAEADQRFSQLRDIIDSQAKQIAELQKLFAGSAAGQMASATSAASSRLQQNWNIGTLIAIVALLMAVATFLMQKH